MIRLEPIDIINAFDEILEFVYGASRGRDYVGKEDHKYAQEWVELGLTIPIASLVFYQRISMMHERWLRMPPDDRTLIPHHPGLFDENIRAAIARVNAGGEPIASWEQSESQWRARIDGFYSKPEIWRGKREMWGNCPDEEGCRAPIRLLIEAKAKRKKTAD